MRFANKQVFVNTRRGCVLLNRSRSFEQRGGGRVWVWRFVNDVPEKTTKKTRAKTFSLQFRLGTGLIGTFHR